MERWRWRGGERRVSCFAVVFASIRRGREMQEPLLAAILWILRCVMMMAMMMMMLDDDDDDRRRSFQKKHTNSKKSLRRHTW